MATSGSTDFELDVSDYIEEAFERCGLEVRTGYDLKTAQAVFESHAGRMGQSRLEPVDYCGAHSSS